MNSLNSINFLSMKIFMFHKIIYYNILLLFFMSLSLFCQETNNSLKYKMDNYEEKVKTKWEYNPFKNYATDRYFSSWLNPNAYNSKFWFGDIFSIRIKILILTK